MNLLQAHAKQCRNTIYHFSMIKINLLRVVDPYIADIDSNVVLTCINTILLVEDAYFYAILFENKCL